MLNILLILNVWYAYEIVRKPPKEPNLVPENIMNFFYVNMLWLK